MLQLQVINFSTGRVINKASFENEITAMDNDHTGQLLFAGDSQVSCRELCYFSLFDHLNLLFWLCALSDELAGLRLLRHHIFTYWLTV